MCPETALTGGNSEARVSYAEVAASQHLLVCCLQELGGLLLRLGSTASSLLTDGSTGLSSSRTHSHTCTKEEAEASFSLTALLDTVVSFLLHPMASVSLAAAWSLRCFAVAMPSQGSQLLDHCCERLMALKSSPEAVVGYGAAVAAMVAAVQHCPLGIPHTKSMVSTATFPCQ